MTTQTITAPNQHRVCPWWVAYFFDNPLRRLIHPADKTLTPYVAKGMSVLDFGCGFGHYALGMARLIGESGTVYVADVQQKMLDKTMARATRAGLEKNIHPLLCASQGITVPAEVDFVLASNSIHETPDPAMALVELFGVLKPGGRFLLIEPRGHLKVEAFENEINQAITAGFVEVGRPALSRQMCVLFQKSVLKTTT
ncbi:MAG: class I SAM-dependent methyltransferase [Desulfobulbaceae bacterium]|nr:MAG: class I SAM-dependent methyltransferase [Desulfobulbaceae bacterium]